MARTLRIAVGAAIVVAALWTAGWHLAADKIATRLDLWVEARRAEGLVVEHAGRSVSGFPGPWVLRVAGPVLAGAGATAWAWQGEALEARLSPWTLRDVAVRFPGEHRVSGGSGTALGGTWRIRAERPNGRIVLDANGKLERLEIDFAEVEFAALDAPSPVHIAHLDATLRMQRPEGADHRQETLLLALNASTVAPVAPPVPALGMVVQSATLDLAVKGRLPSGRLGTALAAWRDDGGTVEINHVSVNWGPVKADGSGTLTLDESNRPLGAFTARWRGYVETIDSLQIAGQLRPWEAAGAKMLLSAMARQQPDGGTQIEVPLTAQNGRVFVAGVPLMRLAPLKLD